MFYEIILIHIYFLIFYIIELYFKKYFFDSIYNKCNLTRYFFYIFSFDSINYIYIYMSIYTIILLNKKIFLINKIIEHNQISHSTLNL